MDVREITKKRASNGMVVREEFVDEALLFSVVVQASLKSA